MVGGSSSLQDGGDGGGEGRDRGTSSRYPSLSAPAPSTKSRAQTPAITFTRRHRRRSRTGNAPSASLLAYASSTTNSNPQPKLFDGCHQRPCSSRPRSNKAEVRSLAEDMSELLPVPPKSHEIGGLSEKKCPCSCLECQLLPDSNAASYSSVNFEITSVKERLEEMRVQMRAQVEAEMRVEIEAEIRAQLLAQMDAVIDARMEALLEKQKAMFDARFKVFTEQMIAECRNGSGLRPSS